MTLAPVERDAWALPTDKVVAFWYRRMRERREKGLPTEERLPRVLRSLLPRTGTPRILDVGSGPYSTLPAMHKGRSLDITAIDALADRYKKHTMKMQPNAKHVAQQVFAEDVLEHFAPASFDIAYSCNALDHCCDPPGAIQSMAMVVRPGGYVVIQAFENEAKRSVCCQHNWNITTSGGRPQLAAKDGDYIDLAALVADTCSLVKSGRIGERRPWIEIVFRRRKEANV